MVIEPERATVEGRAAQLAFIGDRAEVLFSMGDQLWVVGDRRCGVHTGHVDGHRRAEVRERHPEADVRRI